jgi:FkbM family methyltransferase
MKKIVKSVFRRLGLDVRYFTISRSPELQLTTALKIAAVDTVFDIGANTGQFGAGIRSAGYRGRIVSFEPLSSARRELIMTRNGDERWTIHDQVALGSRSGYVDLNIAGNSVSSSILPMLDSHKSASVASSYVGVERVPIMRLDDIADMYVDAGSSIFVKVDTQGYEWEVFDGAEVTLARARGVLCELSLIPLYDGQRLYRDVIARLESLGYRLWAIQEAFSDPRTGQMLQLDAIFMKDFMVRGCEGVSS